MNISQVSSLALASLKVKTTIIASGQEISTDGIRLLEQYTQLRTDYVRQEQWPLHESGVDIDTYDSASTSVYVIASVNGRVVAGMRLTPVNSLKESLSYNMWQFAEEHSVFEKQLKGHKQLLKVIDKGPLWDVTRLIAETSVVGDYGSNSRAYSRVGLLKIMAAATTVTSAQPEALWVFTTTERVIRFLGRSGIHVDVLAEARISTVDSGPASLCIAHPQSILSSLRDKNKSVHRVAKKVIKKHETAR